ncbi:MAG: DUF1659 domain-containing protein [Lactobacillus mulieris]|uniref:DUF1659 domain-containing protein n=1 Tax=Lactobacillus mulieris TaxID=2508708 RepID=A0AAP3GX02_9LACO|nr:DUF1659 domain-containing protein [Lactobacillus mulieris]MCF1783906.1 DUF1659 domain-containing protein [Lactobacillus mulieris]MCT7674326.1 DUF1659 domain-containing protein [Lactobacillus mulieris]MCT7772693.1 DUF1659 domain-containing protein [Lactobacillus mulieris]MCW8104674.1 DUF1659 domain-containing protein [Lactobacillus mulieris]MCZ3844288.1 DUF1659 domain-containing protein [Lactobacillus mulieris]
MNFELLEQSVQYTFSSESYTNGKLTRSLKNVTKDATASALAQVGQALSSLQGDTLSDAILIQKQNIKLV